MSCSSSRSCLYTCLRLSHRRSLAPSCSIPYLQRRVFSHSSSPNYANIVRVPDLRQEKARATTNAEPHLRDIHFSVEKKGDNGLKLAITGIREGRSSVSNEWLRDHCQCAGCINPITKQRHFDIFTTSPKNHRISQCSIDGPTVRVEWSSGHKSEYDTQWLRRAYSHEPTVAARQGHLQSVSWSADTPNSTEVEVQYDDVMNTETGLAEWTRKIRQFGYCFVAGTPVTPEATEALLQRIGPIRNTHYGAFWDFTSNMASKDTAYTSEGLDVHTDTNYFTDPARLQLFHLLQHDGQGGETQLVDGFAAAQRLSWTRPELYDALKRLKMFFHASGNEGLSITPHDAVPVLQTDSWDDNISHVRWNTADRGAMALEGNAGGAKGILPRWYAAAREFNRLLHLNEPELRCEFQLKPGRPLIFDNWRVLHGRSAFTGLRRMCGGYINHDDFISRYRTSNFGHEEVLKHGVY